MSGFKKVVKVGDTYVDVSHLARVWVIPAQEGYERYAAVNASTVAGAFVPIANSITNEEAEEIANQVARMMDGWWSQ